MHGKFIPMVLTGAAQQLKGRLYRFEAARKNAAPDWSGGDRQMGGDMPATPLTDVAAWQGRYVLVPLNLRTSSGRVVTLADAVVRVSQEADIVKTRMAGMDGTVKEYVGRGDWQLEIIIGVQAIDEDGGYQITDGYPDQQVADLRRILTDGSTLEVQSPFLAAFGIGRIVVTRISADQDTASNYQTLRVDALSDEDYSLTGAEY